MLMLCDHKRKIYTHRSENNAVFVVVIIFAGVTAAAAAAVIVVIVGILSSSLPLPLLYTHWHWAQAILCLAVLLLLLFYFIFLLFFCFANFAIHSFISFRLHVLRLFLQMLTISVRWAHKSQFMSLIRSLPTLGKRIDVFSMCIFFIYFTSYRVHFFFSLQVVFLNISLLLLPFFTFFFLQTFVAFLFSAYSTHSS